MPPPSPCGPLFQTVLAVAAGCLSALAHAHRLRADIGVTGRQRLLEGIGRVRDVS